MKYFRIFYKFIVFLSISLTFILFAFCGAIFCLGRSHLCRRYWYWLVPVFSHPLLFLIGVRVNIQKEEYLKAQKKENTNKRKNFYVICNHLGYLDILVVLRFIPSLFITSFETKSIFFLGSLATFGGSLFVNRLHPHHMIKDLEKTRQILKKGYNVTLFPEATSYNGEKLLPFKASLLKAIEKSDVFFLPLCINYCSLGGKPFQLKNRDAVCWYGDMSFLPSIFRLFSLSRVEVDLKILEPISPFQEQGGEVYQDRKAMAEKLYKSIEQHFNPILLPEKSPKVSSEASPNVSPEV